MNARARALVGAAAAAVLLTGCEETAEDRARRLAIDAARRHNAVVGAAVALLLVLLVRHVVAYFEPPRHPWLRQHAARLPGLLFTAALSSEVVGSMVLGLVGAGAGYVFGPTPSETSGLAGNQAGWELSALFLAPIVLCVALVAATLLRLPARLPDVSGSRFFWTAVVHVVAVLYGLGLATGDKTPLGWRVYGAVLAAEGLVGAIGYGYGVVVRSRQRRAGVTR